jgi:hypothetical protein
LLASVVVRSLLPHGQRSFENGEGSPDGSASRRPASTIFAWHYPAIRAFSSASVTPHSRAHASRRNSALFPHSAPSRIAAGGSEHARRARIRRACHLVLPGRHHVPGREAQCHRTPLRLARGALPRPAFAGHPLPREVHPAGRDELLEAPVDVCWLRQLEYGVTGVARERVDHPTGCASTSSSAALRSGAPLQLALRKFDGTTADAERDHVVLALLCKAGRPFPPGSGCVGLG